VTYFTGEIGENRRISKECFLMTVITPEALPFVPGQFVMVRGWKGNDPLLPRPFAIYSWRKGPSGPFMEIVYKVAGRGTRILSGLHRGDPLQVNGPLGNGFTLPEGTKKVVLAGGGIGFSSILPVALHVMESGLGMEVFLGARTAGAIPSLDNIGARSLTGFFSYATEDGSMGSRGLVTDILEKELEKRGEKEKEGLVIFACGPFLMLSRIKILALKWGIDAYLSLENFMACGFGVCLGCVVKIGTDEGFRHLRVCREGPVFPAGEVIFDD